MCWDCLEPEEREHVFDWLEHLQNTLTDLEAPVGAKLTAAVFYQSIKLAMLNDLELPLWAIEPYVDPERLAANGEHPLPATGPPARGTHANQV